MACLESAAEKQSVVLSTGYLNGRLIAHAPADFFKIPIIGYGFADRDVDIDYILDEYSLRVPGDLSLTGYRSSAREEEERQFSSCVIPLSLHAEKCLELVRKRITRGGTPDGARFLDCRFISGTSTGEHKDSTVGVGNIYG